LFFFVTVTSFNQLSSPLANELCN
ncbi:hypothetical protein VCHC17A1_3984B, partial [Vibrio cholerae HC-17A1]